MARKYAKNATTKNNVLKLVKALLALADEKIAVPEDKLKATFNVEWVKEDELQVSGKVQQKRHKRTETVDKGITKPDLWALVECWGEALELPQPKDEKNVDNAQRRGDAIQDVLDCLKDLEVLVLKPSAKTQGFWKFSLKLKHQTADEKDNLKVIEEQWKIKIGSVTGETSHETSKNNSLNWQEICRQNLAQQKQLTTNLFTNAYGVTPQLDEIYVPLAIVERKPSKPPSSDRPEEKEEEKLIPIAEERFFEDVLRQGQSEISQGRKIAIIGEPGAGKTMRLQKIADWILEQDLGLPIWVSLADLTQLTITQYIEDIWLKQTGQSLTIDALTQQKHQIWLLLDGLDEMTSKVELRHVFALLGGWVQAARVVVTCRVNVWEADKNAFSGFDVFRNLEFNPEQVKKYIRRWFAGIGDVATGESLEAALAESENSRLKELIQNPLRLWMLCQIWQTGGGLPETQAGLYGQFVDWVYDWKEDEEISDQREAIDTALARLGLAAMEQKDEVSRLRLRESWVLKILGSRPIFQAVMRLGLLNRVERFPEAICVFYHATFQEYFAALAVENWDDFLPRKHLNFPVQGKKYRIFEPQWKQIILLWLGREDIVDEEKEDFIWALVRFDDGVRDLWEQLAHLLEWGEAISLLLGREDIGDDEKQGFYHRACVDELQNRVRNFYGYQAYFLAAAGINEFKSCFLASEFVSQVVKWGFGKFNTEKQEWETFLDPIKKGARKAIPETIRPLAISAMINLLDHCPDEYIWQDAAESLGKIDPGNPEAIAALVNLIDNTEDKYIWLAAAESLGKIDPGNPEASAALVNLIDNTEDGYIWQAAANSLGKIDPGTPEAIAALVNLIDNTEDDYTRWQAADSLWKIDPGNPEAIAALVNLIDNTEDEDTRWQAANSLWKIDPGNPEAIAALVNLIDNTEDEDTQWQVADSLGKIDPGNPEAIAALVNLIDNTEDEGTRMWAADSLGKIDPGNPEAIAGLLKLIETTEDSFIHFEAPESLLKILTTPEQYTGVVSALKDCLSNEVYQNNFNRFNRCYKVIWNCAENLPYSDFYRAWHGLTETQTSPLVQTLNLPQLLQTQLTETNLHQNLQIFCIDTRKFIDSDNPALEIYEQFLDQNCPERLNGEPETLPQLKSYWNRLRRHSHKPPILIFYEDPTSAPAQGLSPTFLEALTRFEGTICLITDTPHPPLQTFSPHDPDLLQAVVNWLKRLHLES
ncbi:HEAT repeat domain-containing protein [Microcoleus sp. OTE_8_concoct_300]|uniref:HEAT repeat domain-containing protein n=1 Tax=Microcoleus sp. OTE_8_concoct_300 TaxID=2964710 RepID=UPI00403FBB8C